jgi:bifunctional non-homologous end joining protein LigD
VGPEGSQLFVVQLHAARRLHYDFRLEWDGTLKSWAVPKGPSLDPSEKRLAMKVEDHPVEYADFEGIIPPGNYGAGAVIVWDKGSWIPHLDPTEGLRQGKLLFELRGYKLRGLWTLVRTQRDPKEWLLIKKPDGWAGPNARPPAEESILSTLTVAQLRDGRTCAEEIRAELEQAKAPRRQVRTVDVQPMLAESRDEPFSAPGWLFELKHDGYRLLAGRDGARAQLLFRRGRDASPLFPEIAGAVAKLPFQSFTLDGEVVVLDEEGVPSFQRLQKRSQLLRPLDIQRASIELPATLFAFDLLAWEDFDLRPLPLASRKSILRRLLPLAGPLRFCDHVEERGAELFEQIRQRGLEGLIAKKADSPYRAGRSDHWLKLCVEKCADFAVVGFTEPERSRAGFGALELGLYRDGQLVYAGRVGTGFSDRELTELRAALDVDRRASPACSGPIPKERGHVWVEPRLVCEVRFKQWTEEGLLRLAVFVRMRDDKRPEDCVQTIRQGEPAPIPADAAPPTTSERRINLTRLEKVFWPEEGYTKGDLIEFYRSVAPWLLPYLRDRPLVLTRYPDGIGGKSFFQKDAPAFVPSWIRTEKMWTDEGREIAHFVCEDEDSLVYLVNLGTIPLHIWSARVRTLQQPDWCILDLDPKEAPFPSVVQVARAVRALCEEIELPSFAKTSGSAGLHVLIPLGGQCTHAQSTALAELVARVIAQQLPDIATITRTIADRGKRVYLDYLQNGHGKLLASPFCVRPLPGAPVSTPLRWEEVNGRLQPRQFTLANVAKRMRTLKSDPLRPVLDLKPDLYAALERLSKRLA